MSSDCNIKATPGTLHVVATPIGNLEDITLRALRTLRECDTIAAEDTRHTGRLLSHFQIKKPLISVHRFSEARRSRELLDLLSSGKNIALVSDAGTPGISDPGERLIALCLEHKIPVTAVPGASAILHALVVSGFRTTPFTFAGFLPAKKNQRAALLRQLCESAHTTVFFESPHRVIEALTELKLLIPQRNICVARELTKKHEEILRGTTAAVVETLQLKTPRGEYTIVLEGSGN
jgi:16S rRNA (cytidine1402-2'-O)-methyltransferase